jgi:hypothetical protein
MDGPPTDCFEVTDQGNGMSLKGRGRVPTTAIVPP